jgi:lipoyl(octanoyl) transferase
MPNAECRLIVRDLGRMAYSEAFELQKQHQQEVIAWRGRPTQDHHRAIGYLLLVEHDPPVITISRRKTARQHLIATPEQLKRAGVDIAETDRGGDITYHGPGQLVVYPIIDLNTIDLRMHGYMRLLEQIVIDTLDRFGIAARRDDGATGVWVNVESREGMKAERHEGMKAIGHRPSAIGDDTDNRQPESAFDADSRFPIDGDMPYGSAPFSAKICAMGVRVSRWVTMHGLALNVTTNLQHFQLIVPCGLAGRPVTSMAQLLGERCPSMATVKRTIAEQFEQAAAARQGP